MSDPLQLHVRSLRPAIRALDVVGELTGASETSLLDSWGQVGAADAVLVNFSQVTNIDGSGMVGLVALAAKAKEQNTKLMLVGLDTRWDGILEVTRLADDLPLYASEAEALAALDNP